MNTESAELDHIPINTSGHTTELENQVDSGVIQELNIYEQGSRSRATTVLLPLLTPTEGPQQRHGH